MKVFRRTGIGLAVLVALALLWLIGGSAYARHRERQVERAWVQSFGMLSDLIKRYPKTTTNNTARRLEKLVEPLGLDLTPKTHESMFARLRASQKTEEGPAERERHAASAYLTAELEKPDAAIAPPPPEVSAFLVAHDGDLKAIRENLLTSPPPIWEFASAIGSNPAPKPDLLALLSLQRILLTESLKEVAEGDGAAARQTLEASWRLNQSLREIPEVTCQLVALAIARLQTGALRKVVVEEGLWRARLAEHDFKRSLLDAELVGLWPSPERHRQLEEIESRSERSLWKRVQTLFLRPYQDIVWSEVAEKMRLAYLQIKDSHLTDQEVSEERVGSKSSAAEILLSIQMPNLLGAFRRLDRLTLDTELTDKILQARQLRQQNRGRWPAAIPGIEVSHFPGAKWIYSVSPQGTMSLSLSREPRWGDQSGLVLPCRFASS